VEHTEKPKHAEESWPRTALNRPYAAHDRAHAILTVEALKVLLVLRYTVFNRRGLGPCGSLAAYGTCS
jgi:hypothetical protein